MGAALVREGEIALAKGASAVAMHRCKLAVELAPALPAAHACLARAQFAESPTAINSIFAQLGLAANAAMADPRISRAALANLLAAVFVGSLVAALAFIAVLLLRHANLYAHDVTWFPAALADGRRACWRRSCCSRPSCCRWGPCRSCSPR